MLEKSIAIIYKLKKLISAIALPFHCVFCQQPSDRQQDLCQACLAAFPIVTQKCSRCAQKLAVSGKDLLCGSCIYHPPPFAATHSLFAYEAPLTTLIPALKFGRQLIYARILGELMANQLKEVWYCHRPLPDLLIPVPLHKERLQQRGYNQALEIARPIHQCLGIPIEIQAIKRIKNTPAQMKLSAVERRQNLKQAFMYDGDLTDKTIAILDDVMTTGATVTELSYTLLEKGANRIDIWCCARRS